MSYFLLAGDIGGTKTNLALYSPEGALLPIAERSYLNHDFYGLEPLLRQFQEDTGLVAQAACFGIAGVVREGRCNMPNLGWQIDSMAVAAALGFRHVFMLNDLEATAYGISTLTSKQLIVINEGTFDRLGNIALIAAGTGLGEAILYRSINGYYHVSASEGGHADYAPHNEEEIALLRYLGVHFNHVSWERLVSGPGLRNIYDFLKNERHVEEPDWLAERLAQGNDIAAIIAESALNKTSEICIRAMKLFMESYGAEAGNLALKALSTGGLYIGGGIAPKILPAFLDGAFFSAFLNKGRFASLLFGMPIKVILEPKTALFGAATYCRQHIG